MSKHMYAIDLDDTLADFHREVNSVIKIKYGLDIKMEDANHWDYYEEFLSTKDVERAFTEAWEHYQSIQPLSLTLRSSLQRLREIGSVNLVTTRIIQLELIYVLKWLQIHGLSFDSIMALQKSSGMSKSDFNFDVFFDDSPHLAAKIKKDQFLYLIDAPWNQNIKEKFNIKRVKHFDDAIIMETLKAEKKVNSTSSDK